jgi:DNA modification methylase
MKNALINGDSLEILKKLPNNSFDSMVTDPPAGIAFMGKKWDKDKGGRKLWIAWLESIMTEAFRTLKPGAHILVWAIPRTSHWTATAIENAEFEIRDVVTHIFGSGFPKSLNIGKDIDRVQGNKREVVGKVSTAIGTALPSKEGPGPGGNKPATKNRFSGNVLGDAISDEAKQWEGWGTALKPASEHWILARKPLSEKTIAANVLEHGTGGINIDESRVNPGEIVPGGGNGTANHNGGYGGSSKYKGTRDIVQPHNKGRFPANLILSHKPGCKQIGTKEGKGYTINRFTDGAKPFGDGAGHPYEVEDQGPETIAVWECEDNCAVKEVNTQSGIIKGVVRKPTGKAVYPTEGNSVEWNANNVKDTTVRGFDDMGGASRFFYCAKASKKEKTLNKTIENKHPTVKSLKLMKYLINLVTPPGGVVLDPFMGSGTTGQAALEGNFGFVGVELEEASFEISKARCPGITNVIINKKIVLDIPKIEW